jgi:hypothetical protein
MYINPGRIAGILPLYPSGTNSTFFTKCCEVAICDDQPFCPVCGRKVIGWDANSDHERSMIRWEHAYVKGAE